MYLTFDPKYSCRSNRPCRDRSNDARLAEDLHKIMSDLKLTQAEFSRKIGYSYTGVSRALKAQINPQSILTLALQLRDQKPKSRKKAKPCRK